MEGESNMGGRKKRGNERVVVIMKFRWLSNQGGSDGTLTSLRSMKSSRSEAQTKGCRMYR